MPIPRPFPQLRSLTHLVARLLMLWAMLSAQSGVAAVAASTLARLDGAHNVHVQLHKGGVSLVLGHPASRQSAHQHSPVSQLLVACVITSSDTHKDHVLTFSGTTANTSDPASVPGPQSCAADTALAPSEISPARILRPATQPDAPRPPPWALRPADAFPGLRSVVIIV